MPNNLDISIVIPIYNSKKYLAKCLDSILNQNTQYSYEVICINDGSTDESESIIAKFKQQYPDMVVSINQENKGIATARNVGIINARGEYIGFIDDDDYVPSNYVESILSTAKRHNADIVQTGYHVVNPQGHIRSTHSKGTHILDESNKTEWVKWVHGFVWGGCYRKEKVFKKIRFTPGFWYEDMVTRFLFMRQCNKIVIMQEPLYSHTMHAENASKIHWKNNNIKSVDQYWLARSFAEYLIKEQHVEPDDTMFEILSHEWSGLLYSRTKKVKSNVQKAAFYLASEYVYDIGMDGYVADNSVLREAMKGLYTKNYPKWKCASMAYIQYSHLKRR